MILKQMESHLIEMDSLLFKKRSVTIQTNQYRASSIELASYFDVNKMVKMQKKAYNTKNGLTLQTLYNNQLGLEVIDYSDDDNIYPYRNRFQVALDWNVIESSLIGRKTAHELLELEGLLNTYRLQQQHQNNKNETRILKSSKYWDSVISFLQIKRVDLLNQILKLRSHLYDSRRVLYSDIASIQREIFSAKASISSQDNLTNAEQQLIDLDSYLSKIKIDTIGLFERYIDNNFDLKQYPVQQQMIELNKNTLSYIKQMKMGVFTKMQYFGGGTGAGYNGKLSIGVSASFPLSREHRRQKEVITHQVAMNKREEQYAKENSTIQYRQQMEMLSQMDNQYTQELAILKSIIPNIINYREMSQRNIISIETLLFEYDAYIVVLTNIYLTIKKREILIESLMN